MAVGPFPPASLSQRQICEDAAELPSARTSATWGSGKWDGAEPSFHPHKQWAWARVQGTLLVWLCWPEVEDRAQVEVECAGPVGMGS